MGLTFSVPVLQIFSLFHLASRKVWTLHQRVSLEMGVRRNGAFLW